MKLNLLKVAMLFLAMTTQMKYAPLFSQTVPIGSGSYTTTFPGVDQAGRNSFPSGTPGLSGIAATKPVPTNDWWSDLMKTDHGGKAFNYPLSFESTTSGLIINYTIPLAAGPNDYRQPISDVKAITVGTEGLNTSSSTASDHSDWGVTMNWNDDFSANMNIGSPFVYFEKNTSNAAKVSVGFNAGGVSVDGNKLIISGNMNNSNYVVFGPAGSTWNGSGGIYTSTLSGKNYWSMALLPFGVNIATAISDLEQYAYVYPGNTAVDWDYNESTGKVRTTFTVTPDVKEGANNTVLQGLLPHQWDRLASNSAQPTGPTYPSVRGTIKTLSSNTFIVENTFSGILPTLPDLGKYSSGFDPGALSGKIEVIKNDGLPEWTDSYNQGQDMNRMIQAARISDQMGDLETRDLLVAKVQARLEDWLSFESGEVAFLFYYNEDWKALIGYPAGHSQDVNLNDHHFHWGYFIHAAAAIEQFNPGWAAQWGDMINLLVRDAANPSRTDSMFPFLRNFSPYAGHSWANGFASQPFGNDQESTSESMQFNSALIHWGTLTNNDELRDLGVYLYTTEQSTIEEYWFDVEERSFQPEYDYEMVARVWGGGYDNGTWWTSDVAASYGIQLYPIHGGSLYLGHRTDYVQRVWTEMTENTPVLSNTPNDNLWYDTYWKFLSFIDPQEAVNLYNAYTERSIKVGISDAQTYHWLHAMNSMGQVKNEVTADYPIAAAFESNGAMTYVAHNYGNAQITVQFSDGFSLTVPANSMATDKDINAAITLASDQNEIATGGSVNLTTNVSGSGITKVEFYAGETLLNTDNTAPYEANTGALAAGFKNIYAKVYVGNSLNISNVIAIQVGSQNAFSGVPTVLPGTIEPGHYDTFEGGLGQGVAYSDNGAYNEGDFRTTEGVDAATSTSEGATVGWIEAGEWLEYTVNASQAGAYQATLRYASGSTSGGGPFWFERDGNKISADVNVAFTGTDWSVWQNVVVANVNLVAGEQVIRLQVQNGGFNLGRMTFAFNGTGDPVLTTINVTPSTQSLELGATQQFTASGLDQFGAPFVIAPTWSATGGTINGSGLYTGSTLGNFTISVSDGSIIGTADVTVSDSTPILSTINLSPSSTSMVINGTKQFTAEPVDQFGNEFVTTLNWSASCGTIDANGLYNAPAGAGNCIVNVNAGAISINANVQVNPEGGLIGDVLWEENFNTLNMEQWSPNTGDGCDVGLCGWGNQELEYYSPDNVYVEGISGEPGNNALVLEAKNEAVGGRSFTSGKIDTDGKVSIQYGLIEVRMKVPDLATGLWPAAWLLGDANLAWPAKGEIDIMEMGHNAEERERQGFPGVSENDYVGANAIWGAPDGSAASIAWDVDYNQPYIADTPLNDRFVTYRLYWEPTQMRFTVIDNGEEHDLYTDVLPINDDLGAFNKPFYMLLNLAVGGNFTDALTPGQVSAPLPAKMYVDYVRVSEYNGHGDVTFSDGTLVAETGTFGVFTETTPTNNELNFGSDAEIFVWGETLQDGTIAPIEGTEVLAWETVNANGWFGAGITSLYGRNMSNFSENGSLKFKIKIPSGIAFKIGITDNYTNEEYITFPAGETKYGLVRDGEWGQVEIPLVDLGGLVAFQDLNYMLAIASVDGSLPSSTFQFAIDDIVWTDGNGTSPILTSIVVSPSNAIINEGGTQSFTAQGLDQNGDQMSANIVWSASAGGINTAGLYTGSTLGSHTITATSGSTSGTASITVNTVAAPVLTSIVVSPANSIIDEGQTVQYTAAGLDQFGAAFVFTPSWSTTGGSIDQSGLFTGVNAGDFTISVTSASVIGTASITVNSIAAGWVLPGIVEAENFNSGGQGVGYNDNTSGNTGGDFRTTEDVDIETSTDNLGGQYNVGWIEAGEWLAFDINATSYSNTYDLSVRVASPNGNGRLHIEIDGVDVTGTMIVPNTGSWQVYTSVTASDVTMTPGNHTMRIVFDASGLNLNYVEAVEATTPVSVLTSIVLSPDNVTIDENQSLQFTAAGFDQFGAAFAISPSWSATGGIVNSDGLFTGSSAGSFVVTASQSGVSSNVNVTVNAVIVPVLNSIVVSPAIAVIDEGSSQQFTAAGFDQFGAAFTINPVWTANGGSMSSTGLFSGSMAGTYTINATSGAIIGNASITVNSMATGWALPGRVEAENFNGGGQSVGFSDTTPGNTGGAFRNAEDVDIETTSDNLGGLYNVGWITAGEWLEYDINATATSNTYDLSVRVASPSGDGRLHIEIDGVDVTGTLVVPNTGSWQVYTTVTASNVTIAQGNHTMRVVFDASGLNLNYVEGAESSSPVPVLSSIVVSPGVGVIDEGQTLQFTAAGFDQFGASYAINPSWSATGGSVSSNGLYTGSTTGSFSLSASQGGVTGSASLTVNQLSTGCSIAGFTGDFTTDISDDSSNPTLTFMPLRNGVGDNIVILYYGATLNGSYAGSIVTPGQAFQINASAGQSVYFYYTYSIPEGGENNTSANKDSFVVGGSCGSSARLGSTGSQESLNANTFTLDLFPNPVNQMLNIRFSGIEINSISVYNLTGSRIFDKVDLSEKEEIKLDVSSFENGHYFLQVRGPNNTKMLRFIKK